MSQQTFKEFHANFTKAPDKTLKQFAILTAMNDKMLAKLLKIDINDKNFKINLLA